MDQHQFTFRGRRILATRYQVLAALRGLKPDRVYQYVVEIGGVTYPITQAFAVAFDFPRAKADPRLARRVFLELGFPPYSVATRRGPFPEPDHWPAENPRRGDPSIYPGEIQTIEVPRLVLYWTHWHLWNDIRRSIYRGGNFNPPPARPGVYEVKREGEQQRLYIGKALDLGIRIKYALVDGLQPHHAGRKIRANEDTSRLLVRWAETDHPAAAEEELHRLHLLAFGELPTYTRQT